MVCRAGRVRRARARRAPQSALVAGRRARRCGSGRGCGSEPAWPSGRRRDPRGRRGRARSARPVLAASRGTLARRFRSGVWVVQEDGSKRLLGEYREASWSPFGRFVVAVRENELAALEPDGDVRWTLPRRDVTSPSWAGTETDTRIAYFDGSGIRVVAGDGTGDRLLIARCSRTVGLATGRRARARVRIRPRGPCGRRRERPLAVACGCPTRAPSEPSRLVQRWSAAARFFAAESARVFETRRGALRTRAQRCTDSGRGTGPERALPRVRTEGSRQNAAVDRAPNTTGR